MTELNKSDLETLKEWRSKKIEELNTDRSTIIDLYYKLFPDYCVQLAEETNYLGDFKINMLGARNEFNIEVFAHEIGHFIFFAGSDIKRLTKRNYGMFTNTSTDYVETRKANTVFALQHEIAAVAISTRIMEYWNLDQANLIGHADVDLIVNRLNFFGKELIPVPQANAFKQTKGLELKTQRLEELQQILSQVDHLGNSTLSIAEYGTAIDECNLLVRELKTLKADIKLLEDQDRMIWAKRIFDHYYSVSDLQKIKDVMNFAYTVHQSNSTSVFTYLQKGGSHVVKCC